MASVHSRTWLRGFATTFVAALAGAGLAGCGEKPQRDAPAQAESTDSAAGDNLRRERTLHQGESRRIGI